MSFEQPGGVEVSSGSRVDLSKTSATIGGLTLGATAEGPVKVVNETGHQVYVASRLPHGYSNPDVTVEFSSAVISGEPVIVRHQEPTPPRYVSFPPRLG